MRHPWSVPVLLALAALAGYAVGARPVQAQAEQWPVGIGQDITLTLPGGGTHRCLIEAVRGTFARCGDRQKPSLNIGQRERPEQWVNLAQVDWITKARQER
jgi:hypothetical protein